MDDLVAFLGACLDEDERVARACVYDNATDRWHVEPGDDSIGWHEAVVEESGIRLATGTRAVNVHIVRWDPARVLAEVAAKREILTALAAELPGTGGTSLGRFYYGLIMVMAQPFAGRPGWRPEWATEVEA